jgi:hypothetical protein
VLEVLSQLDTTVSGWQSEIRNGVALCRERIDTRHQPSAPPRTMQRCRRINRPAARCKVFDKPGHPGYNSPSR